ncbi:MAG: hypothetical protein ACQERI_10225 [Candidatus Krumholzibacteriota bacterium]
MHDTLDINNLILTVIFSAFGVLIPVLFHLVGLGSIFLPMFIPLAAGAFFLSPVNALILGMFTPLASALLTGMPPFYPPVALIMMAGLGVFCITISVLSHRTPLPRIAVLSVAILAERIILLLFLSVIMPALKISYGAFSFYELVKGAPGMILILVTVPLMVRWLERVISSRSLKLFEHSH